MVSFFVIFSPSGGSRWWFEEPRSGGTHEPQKAGYALSCALERACLGWVFDSDLRLAPQHLGNGGFGSQVRPRNIFDRSRSLRTPTRGRGWARAYQLYDIMWRFLHTRTSHRPCPTTG
jgi:hypothetical protein